MSYCRFLEGDVYVFMSVGGWLECCACSLSPETSFSVQCDSTQSMLDHLDAHRAAGHYIPDHVYDDLKADDSVNFPKGTRA